MAGPTRVSRALSQNFLADRAAAGRLARLAVPLGREAPLLLEVGAGKGALTEQLAPHCTDGDRQRLAVMSNSLAWKHTFGDIRF